MLRTDGVFSGRHVFIKTALLRKVAPVAASCVPPLLLMVPRCCGCDASLGRSVLHRFEDPAASTNAQRMRQSSRLCENESERHVIDAVLVPVGSKIPDSSFSGPAKKPFVVSSHRIGHHQSLNPSLSFLISCELPSP